MGLSFTTNQAGAPSNYAKYLSGSPVKTDKLNQPDLLDFTLIPYDVVAAGSSISELLLESGDHLESELGGDFLTEGSLLAPVGSFVKLLRGTRIILSSTTYGNWFTGYITNDPTLSFLGTRNGSSVYGYFYEATDDSYILNLQPVGLLPPFINTTTGAIIKQLVSLLDADGVFDISNIQDGEPISRYIVDPTKKFTEILQDFTDPMAYRWRCNNFAITYEPEEDTPAAIVIDGSSKHFNAGSLQINSTTDPFINDSIIIGSVEPQEYINEYFLGDGATAAYPLMETVYGVTSAILIDENFSSSTINTQFWTVFDTPQNFLQVNNGYLNVLGGDNNNTYDVSLQSASVLALERVMRLTHGQWDFLPTATDGINGVIAALWTQAPNTVQGTYGSILLEDGFDRLLDEDGVSRLLTEDSSPAGPFNFPGCFYGLQVSRSAGVTSLHPIVNGITDMSQQFVIDYTKRYVIRTIINYNLAYRRTRPVSFLRRDGSVGRVQGPPAPDIANIQTFLVAIDPTTGGVTQRFTFSNNGAPLDGATTYAYYIPVASNNLHATVTGITISYPLLASMDISDNISEYTAGVTVPQIIGPNDIDSLDGLAPVATIVQATSSSSRNNNLGSVQYDAGNPTLAFFKDSTKQTATTPPARSLIHLKYRAAGVAVGRVQDPASVEAEANAWGDNGLRSQQRSDLKPLPLTSVECELAATAQIQEYGYQHYEGQYVQMSPYEFTGEPLSGTILKFKNLGSSYPADFQAALIDQVTSSMDGDFKDIFTHTVHFGKLNKAEKVLAGLAGKSDVLGVLDPADPIAFVDVNSVGTVFAPDVVAPTFRVIDPDYYYFQTNQDPPSFNGGIAGGFEVRSTDASWGSDDSRNLIGRFPDQYFSVPRTARGRVAFVKAYDIRNFLLWSEDFTQGSWLVGSGVIGVTRSTGANPAYSLSYINSIAFSSVTNGYVKQVSNVVAAVAQKAVFSVSVKGSIGQSARIQLGDDSGGVLAYTEIILNGRWQRVSVSGTFAPTAPGFITCSIVYTGATGATGVFDTSAYDSGAFTPVIPGTSTTAAATRLLVTRASLETGILSESAYFKTNGTPYGAVSRFAAGMRCNFPLKPPAPTATLTYNEPSNILTSIILPQVLQDVWGVEVRSDVGTVLYSSDLTAAGFTPSFNYANQFRTVMFNVYTYNLLGEYSDPFPITLTIPPPQLSSLTVDDAESGLLTWGVVRGDRFGVIIATDPAFTNIVVNTIATGYSLPLDDDTILHLRYFMVTPMDPIGGGTPIIIAHQHTPSGVQEWDALDELFTVPQLPAPATDVVVPPKFTQYANEIQETARRISTSLLQRNNY